MELEPPMSVPPTAGVAPASSTLDSSFSFMSATSEHVGTGDGSTPEQATPAPAQMDIVDLEKPATLPETQPSLPDTLSLQPDQHLIPQTSESSLISEQSLSPRTQTQQLPQPDLLPVESLDLSTVPFDPTLAASLPTLPLDLSLVNGGLPSLNSFDGVEVASASILDETTNNTPDPMQAFAKLQFLDGDFYVNTYAVKLGRDLNAEKHVRRHKKIEKRRVKREHDDGEQEQDGQDLDPFYRETRKPGAAMSVSNVSETGGIMGLNVYSSSDESTRRRKRKGFHSSNSVHSVDPSNLSANPQDLFLKPFNPSPPEKAPLDPLYECPLVPIHPPTGQSLKGISREHVKIEYNLGGGFWEMTVLGKNGVYHDNNYLNPGEITKLHHGSQIQIQFVPVTFKLPDVAREDEEEEPAVYESESPLSDIGSENSSDNRPEYSDASNLSSGDDDTPLRIRHKPIDQSPAPRKVVKLKLSLKKGQTGGKSAFKKTKAERASTFGKHPAKTEKKEKSEKAPKVDKGDKVKIKDRDEKKEKEAEKEREQEIEKAEARPSTEMPPPAAPLSATIAPSVDKNDGQLVTNNTPSETPPTIPAELPPGSILVGVAPEDIPQKRKGPGRPPKNGVMSKRDEAIIKRKKKEYEKMGVPLPSLNELLAIARLEGSTTTTKKDAKSEEAQNGEDVPKPSIEDEDATPSQVLDNNPTVSPSVEVKDEGSAQPSQAPDDKDANKPKRVAKSPSPQKPESAYTEEELKKPTATYVVLIHEALTKCETGIMDLQAIYDAIQKMYPYFKYRSQTHGWQSSVRHNLISSEAFQEAGKVGKGRLWKINPNVSIDKEKKRKAPTPPPERPTHQYPYYPNGQYPYGPPQPGAPPSYPQQYRPSPYGTPYGPPTVSTAPRPPVPPSAQKPGTYYSPYAANPGGAGATHASPYGPPSRPPYAAYPVPTSGQTSTPGQPPRPAPSPYGQAPVPAGQQTTASPYTAPPTANPPQINGQAPRQLSHTPGVGQTALAPPPPQQQQSDLANGNVVDAIMNFHREYVGTFKTSQEMENARAVFRKATNRLQQTPQTPYETPEEEKLYKEITRIIEQCKVQTARASPALRPPQPGTPANGAQPTQGQPIPTPAPATQMQTVQGTAPIPVPVPGNTALGHAAPNASNATPSVTAPSTAASNTSASVANGVVPQPQAASHYSPYPSAAPASASAAVNAPTTNLQASTTPALSASATSQPGSMATAQVTSVPGVNGQVAGTQPAKPATAAIPSAAGAQVDTSKVVSPALQTPVHMTAATQARMTTTTTILPPKAGVPVVVANAIETKSGPAPTKAATDLGNAATLAKPDANAADASGTLKRPIELDDEATEGMDLKKQKTS